MAIVFYNIFLLLYRAAVLISSLWNKKARLWLVGRRNIFDHLSSELRTNSLKITWFHCSSLGEFEQGRPVIEKLKARYPDTKILLTFFSPSGYEIRKNYNGADWVFYLPPDSKINAKKFFEIVNPCLVVFVKYDFWYYFLAACKERKIPLLMISAIFRKDQTFFHWYGSHHRKMLKSFTHLFVQDEESKDLLLLLKINNVTVAGDTRFDRVAEIIEKFQPINEIEKFCGNSKVLVAGSTWPADEKIIKPISDLFPELKVIIAPHEIHKEQLNDLKNLFPDSVLLSELLQKTSARQTKNAGLQTFNCLIIDNIGMLSKLYSYATIAYIGGGFDKGIHNVLEAAVYGKPVIFGPRYEKYQEAIDLKKNGAGYNINNKDELEKLVCLLLNDQKVYTTSCESAGTYVQNNKGATDIILNYIQENRLLTN